MSDNFTQLDPAMELPLEALLTKPVQQMSDEELSNYRQQLSLLRRPQTLTAKLAKEGTKTKTKKETAAKATSLASKYL